MDENLSEDFEIVDVREIKKCLQFSHEDYGTWVVAVAMAKDFNYNRMLNIPVSGEPLSPEVYDVVRDVYCVAGIAYFEVGLIPVNYVVSMKGITCWSMPVPLPPSIVRKHMTEDQKERFDVWKSEYGDYEIRFLQAASVF